MRGGYWNSELPRSLVKGYEELTELLYSVDCGFEVGFFDYTVAHK